MPTASSSAWLRSLLSRPLAASISLPVLYYGSSLLEKPPCSCELKQASMEVKQLPDHQQARLIFLGTGSSTGCPRPLCTMLFHGNSPSNTREMKEYFDAYCTVSKLAVLSSNNSNPADNKNYRNNPSLLLQTPNGLTTIIDVGKTFREGALRWFPRYNIGSIDAIVLTHEHMDAAGGLDDVRGFQKYEFASAAAAGKASKSHGRPSRMVPMPLHLSQQCYDDLQKRFPWLLPRLPEQESVHAAATTAATKPLVQRHVASFSVQTFTPFKPFVVNDGQLAIIPLPVMHGEDLVSFGFAFRIGKLNVVYLSDISRMLPETMEYIRHKLPPTDILVLDALHETERNAVHYSLTEALALVDLIQPKQTYLVGMSCDSFLPHDDMNQLLHERYGDVLLAHDGLEMQA